MPLQTFDLTAVVRVFADGIEIAEALGFPELSCLAEKQNGWENCLVQKARQLLQDAEASNTLRLHRRCVPREAIVEKAMVKLAAPPRRADWTTPIDLNFHYVRWSERADLHHAFVPVLSIHVFAHRLEQLPERVEKHIRMVLVQGQKRLTLADLAPTQLIREVRLEAITVSANIKTPRERAQEDQGNEETASVLERVATNLQRIRMRPAYEVDALVQNLADALGGAHPRSVLLVGPSGTGKTALIHELVRRARDFGYSQTPFWSTSGAQLVAGQVGFGMWQARCRDLCREAVKTGAIVHFGNLAELHEVGKTSRTEQSIAAFLRPWIARGELLAIAECTPEQLQAIERSDPHLAGGFLQLPVPEPSPEITARILKQVWQAAEGKSPEKTSASDDALDWLHRLHQRYATYSSNPGRPLRFLSHLLADQFPDKALTTNKVTQAFHRETGLPLVLLDDRVALDVDVTRQWFAQRVIGQPQAVEQILDLLVTAKARLARPRKPLASLLLIGPTGVGKTELAKALAEYLFGDVGRMVRFDMSEYSNPLAVQRLIGGPAAGGAEGLLTARVREQPFSVLLLDEFEKADASFFDLLLQVLGDGRLTDAVGRVADFCNSVIVMTSNLGAQSFQRGSVGFGASTGIADATSHFDKTVRDFLRPEIYNRLDGIVPFSALSSDIILAITRRQLDLLWQRDGIRLRPLKVEMPADIAEHLAQRGFDSRYGARPLRRAIEKELLLPLAEALNEYDERRPLVAELSARSKELTVEVHSAPKVQDPSDAPVSVLDVVAERRRIQRLRHCQTTQTLENEASMHDWLAHRIDRSKWKDPAQFARLQQLREIRKLLDSVTALLERAQSLETEVLTVVYRREPIEPALFAADHGALARERHQLMRAIFRSSIEEPDRIVFALYSEHPDWLLRLTKTYLELVAKLDGKLVNLDYFTPPPKRTPTSVPIRTNAVKVNEFLEKPPAHLLGVVLHLQGELFWPRFSDDAGLHVLHARHNSQLAILIETSQDAFADYQPPLRIDRQGTISLKGQIPRRSFRPNDGVAEDCALGSRPLIGEPILPVLTAFTEERLERAFTSLID